MIQNLTKFVQALSDSDLKNLQSAVGKEQRRRKKIVTSNNTWICNQGLKPVLEASLKK